jgi:hypothetical protein
MGGTPNGYWTLYVYDSQTGERGKIASGWDLTIDTAEPDTVVPAGAGASTANPYPSTRTVGGMSGVITDVNVSLAGVYHRHLTDLDLVLVGPHGQTVVLMSGACGDGGAKNLSFTWDDQAPGPMPANADCSTGAYQPTDYQPGETLPGPAPPGPYGSSLSAFNLTDPNGAWRLYANEDNPQPGYNHGFFVEQFKLNITTRPAAAVGFPQPALDVTEGMTTHLTLSRSNADSGLGTGAVTVTGVPRSATPGSDFTPVSTTVEFAPGETQKTVPIEALTDGATEGPETFAVTIGGATGDATPGAQSTAVVTIHDPEPQPGSGDGGGGGGGPGPDRDAPVIGPVSLNPPAFALTRRTTIRFSLSEPATLTLRFQRAIARRRWVGAGRLQRSGALGLNRLPFSGRVGRRALRRGRYRVVVTAVDSAGNRSTARTRAFRIVG